MMPGEKKNSSVRDLASLFSFYRMELFFLSLVFLDEPDAEFLESIGRERLFDNWPCEPVSKHGSRGIRDLRSYFSDWEPGRIEQLRRDYIRLFIGLERTLAPPFASVYLSEEHLLCQEPFLKVREYYDKLHLQTGSERQMPDDHIGFELHFLSCLCGEMSQEIRHLNRDLLEEKRCLMNDFLHSHLLRWLKDFCTHVEKNAETLFYRAMAALTMGLVESLARLISDGPAGARLSLL